MFIWPADFLRVRHVTLRMPVSTFVPKAEGATLTLSIHNFADWINGDFPAMDPEMIGSGGPSDIVRNITEHVPGSARAVASLRVVF